LRQNSKSFPTPVHTARIVYTAVIVSALWFCCFKSSKPVFAEVGILAAFSVWPFWFEHLPALRGSDASARKLASGKLKSLLMLAVILILVEQILAKGF
jgi:hypothetical protein